MEDEQRHGQTTRGDSAPRPRSRKKPAASATPTSDDGNETPAAAARAKRSPEEAASLEQAADPESRRFEGATRFDEIVDFGQVAEDFDRLAAEHPRASVLGALAIGLAVGFAIGLIAGGD